MNAGITRQVVVPWSISFLQPMQRGKHVSYRIHRIRKVKKPSGTRETHPLLILRSRRHFFFFLLESRREGTV